MDSVPRVIAHRGFSSRYPENTLAAIRAAIKIGADLVEIDVQETTDGQVVVFHDYRLQRLCGLDNRIDRVTLRQLRAAKPDVPTLAQALRAVRGHATLLIEMKRVDARKVAAIIKREGMVGETIVFSFSRELMEVISRTSPEIPRWGLFGEDFQLGLRELRSTVSVQGVGLGSRWVTDPRIIARLHREQLQVNVWTVNSPHRMKQLAQWGVDGIITNFPDRARELFGAAKSTDT